MIDLVREKYGVPESHTLEEIKGWWSEVNADIRVWIHRDEKGAELLRYKMEQFSGDIKIWSIVDDKFS